MMQALLEFFSSSFGFAFFLSYFGAALSSLFFTCAFFFSLFLTRKVLQELN